ncbi:uncharacterized protein LOC114302180 [Camellia sinensis]|uniref:uncharacterized protein LOC114302180 n=1 Tax=Camellia sinensis TaxID=4442 RepID=UPI001036DB36|nr:uncharacterized protein LOC114302180 [Camellia sinensis]
MRRNSVYNMILNESDSDDELEIVIVAKMEEESRSRQRRVFIRRNTLQGHQRLFLDYFTESPIYPPNVFRKRFRMNRSLFLRIHSTLKAHEPYFVQKRNGAGVLGLSSYQKMTVALRMLAYGVVVDFMDGYVRIGERTAMKSLKKFVKAVVTIFSDEYLRSPNKNDIARLLTIGQSHGFPGMLGSIDCMHWKWKNCPTAWKGHIPSVNYLINGNDYTMGYYLADGIYPQWSTFVKTIPSPQGNKRKHFTAAQESARKDVERAFGVLQARFAIVRGPARSWERKTLKNIMKACIILHNMIVEDERDVNEAEDYDYEQIEENPNVSVSHEHTTELMEFIRCHHCIRDRETHSQLQSDLVKHLWVFALVFADFAVDVCCAAGFFAVLYAVLTGAAYEEVLSELEYVKQELSKLKVDMASVLEEKNRAEKEIEVLNSRLTSYSSFGEALKKEIEEVNEEQVMVELAWIEAVKELGVIQAQRKEEEMKTC